jgi:hypothetical protein
MTDEQQQLQAAFLAGYNSSIEAANRMFDEYKKTPLTEIVLTVDDGKASIDFQQCYETLDKPDHDRL